MNPVYGYVRDRILKKIEDAINNGTKFSWCQPWSGGRGPWRWKANKPYRGINVILLPPGEYITKRQVEEIAFAHPEVRLKEKAQKFFCVFFKFDEKKDEDGEVVERRPILRYYYVYSISDVENLDPRFKAEVFENDPVDEAEEIAAKYIEREHISLRTDGNSAYYAPGRDEVVVPNISRFKIKEEYYSTLFHELTHSTGHSKRLNRIVDTAHFGSKDYSKEELVAELGASFLCAMLGMDVETEENSVAYLQNWLSALRNGDPKMIVSAAGKAQRAVDYILDVHFDEQGEE